MTEKASDGSVVIAGGSGFLGTSLAEYLHSRGWSVIVLSRSAPRKKQPWQHVCWDARTLGDWRSVLEGAAGLINLAGRSVDCIKTPDQQDVILRSRIESTRILGTALRETQNPPPVWIQMSSAHLYGDPPSVWCTEDSPFGCGFAPFVVQRWEAEFKASLLPGQRPVLLRTSFVIGRDRGAGNGAMSTLTPLARWGLGGTVGSGLQGISWLHEDDLNRLIGQSLTDSQKRGAYIASSPNPVSSRDFMRELRRAIHMPVGLPAPAWMVRLGANWVFRTDPDLALYGRYVISSRLQKEGFNFHFPEIREALASLFSERS